MAGATWDVSAEALATLGATAEPLATGCETVGPFEGPVERLLTAA
jgi:hypothetical protein